MFPKRRGTEMRVPRRSCSGTATHLFPYAPSPEAPLPTAHSPLLRGQREFPRYDNEFLQPTPSFVDARYRGYPDRISPRFLPYSGLEGGMTGMPTMVVPVRTVPTSITVPPSKQVRSNARMEYEPRSESAYLPFPNGGESQQQQQQQSYLSRTGIRVQDAPIRGMERTISSSLQRNSIQKICALLMAHCLHCKTDGCCMGESCARVKELWRHIVHCNLKERCTNDKCYAVKKGLAHFRNCSVPNCLPCSHLKQMINDIQCSIHSVPNPRVKREMSEVMGTSLFPPEQSVRPGPIRKSHFAPGLDPFPVDRPPKGEFSGEAETDGLLYPHPTTPVTNNYFIELPANFPVDPVPHLPATNPPVPMDPPRHRDQAAAFQLGTSLFETFDPKEIESYLKAVRCCDAFPNKPESVMKDKICAVCLQGEQTFQPIQLYCDCCFARIKRGGMYWKTKPEATTLQICACHKCFSSKKDGSLTVGQMNVPLIFFHPCKNDECVTETWVACDKCGYWVHSSCGLFNRGENNEDAKYMCPFCLKEEMELGHRVKPATKPVSMWGASELPRCALSDFIQSKLNDQVQEEMTRLRLSATECLPLTVCVLMSTKKVTKVQPVMAASFPELPTEYPYHQRVIGVFQKIHGVDVLLFCMYVQEYGDDCEKPNQRWVNLEYIDSVKHFIPDMKTVRGDSLRSVVYKETLLAYVEFVKRRGFEVFYIWACPPGKEGEDYILHCKPKTQRIPSADRLRIWYRDLLKMAKDRKIVTHDSNLMDTFFTCGMDRAVGRPFSAAEMPYFEGDYWPGEAEKILKALRSSKGVDYCRKPGEKRKTRGEMSLNESLENGLMLSLPFPRWSDFMVWHLQEPCSLCQTYITNGNKFVYHFDHANGNKQTEPVKKRAHFEGIKLGRPGAAHSNTQFFQICDTCYQTCAAIGEGGPIPESVNFSDLEREYVAPSPSEVGDFDNAEDHRFSEIFESRQAFLAFCKGNHYQFDTLQHAKHSTMMLLYHLHNTKAPVFPTICRGCGIEIPTAVHSEKRDQQTPEFCRTCRSNAAVYGARTHAAPSVPFGGPSTNSQMQIKRVTENFEHAAYCRTDPCMPDCRKMKELLKHAQNCRVGASSCRACRVYGMILRRHAHFCNRPCTVPDCERIKAMRKQQMRLDQEQRSRVYIGEASGSSSSS